MIRKVLALASVAVLLTPSLAAVAAPVIANAAPASDNSIRIIRVSARGGGNQNITMGLNKAVVVELDSDVKDVMVSSPDIVDAVVKSPRRIYLLAAKVGQTNAFFLDEQGRHLLSLDLRVERDTGDLDSLMKATMPKSAIRVTAMADNIVLSGNVPSALEAGRAASLAASFTGDPKKVINMLSVAGGEQVMLKVRVAEMDRSIAKQFGVNTSAAVNAAGVPMTLGSSNPFGLLGHALSDASGGQLGSVCPQQFFPNTSSTSTATTGFGTQLLTDVTTGAVIPIPGTNPIQLLTARAANDTLANTVTSTMPCSSANNAQGILSALEQVGLVHMLAEPNMTAVNGETAKFRAGGEFPVPVSRDRDGNITVDYKQFGVGLSFTPVVLSPERISIQMSTEVSELSSQGSYSIGGSTSTVNGITTTTAGLTIPALSVRRAETTVELPSGGSFAIAGLMQHVNKQVIDGFPALKDMPVLGALFRSRDYQNDETEMVVIVSAYLVEPNAQSAFAAPTDGFVPPSDPETLLLGRLNAVYKDKDKPTEAMAAAPVGFIVQ
jgi:pilus assembly protein CpaC